MGVEAVLARL
jgi:hypothetical protein